MGLFKQILTYFPRGGLSYVYAYGSGVKQQQGYEAISLQNENVIDFTFCVRDPLGWHAENMSRNPNHYSMLRLLGPRSIMRYQEGFGAGVYFNTLVNLEDIGVTIKYGVITREQLLDDLLTWRNLYLAGRLQKPVQVVVPTDDNALVDALSRNLLSAFQVALLLLPERFTAFELFHTICSLSYRGDFRMIFGENKEKVRNIVNAQKEDFFKLYRPAMVNLSQYVAVDTTAREIGTKYPVIQFEQDKSQAAIEFLLRQVPAELRKRLIHNAAFRGSYMDIVEHLARTKNLGDIVQVSVNDIVWRSSILQSLKNIPSAGFVKSIIYSFRKVRKTFL